MTASWRSQRRTRVKLFDGEPQGICSPRTQSTGKSFHSHLRVPSNQRSVMVRERNGQTVANDDQFSFQVWPFGAIHRESVCGKRLWLQGGLYSGILELVQSPASSHENSSDPIIPRTHDILPSCPPSRQFLPPSQRPRKTPPPSSLPVLLPTTQSCNCLLSLSQRSVP